MDTETAHRLLHALNVAHNGGGKEQQERKQRMDNALHALFLGMIAKCTKNGSSNAGVNSDTLGLGPHSLHQEVLSEH